jgi:hypothetical protein
MHGGVKALRLATRCIEACFAACECQVLAWEIKEEKNSESWSWIRMNESDLDCGRILGQGII